ncbi:MAG: CapA family protein [Eubacteriales bacterium]|nr:CapA family protein [Eubacteriales bacterium]
MENERKDPKTEVQTIKKEKRPLSSATPDELDAYYRRKREREARKRARIRKKKIMAGLSAAAVLILLILLITGIASLIRKGKKTDKNSGENVTADSGALQEAEVTPAVRTITPTDLLLTFTGDFILGTDEYFAYDTSMNAYYDENTPDYFLSGVKDVFEQDDLTIINFESTLTEETDRVENQFAFKAPPEYINIIDHASIEAANVANNHSHDYGEKSFTDTLAKLEEGGIKPFGYDKTAVLEVKGVKVGIFGIYELDDYDGVAPEITQRINELKEQKVDLIIGVFHWGNELESYPDKYQVQLGHQAIDEGADLVVGHHPHVIQGIEYYKGKTIAYSLGNFLFGGNANPTEIDTMIFQMKFSLDERAKITDQQINIIPCLEGTNWDYNDYQPTIVTGEDAQYIIDKLDERSREIAENYTVESVYNSSTDGTIGFKSSGSAKTEEVNANAVNAASSDEEAGSDADTGTADQADSGNGSLQAVAVE